MIVFVKVSPRRYIVLDTPKQETAWRNTRLSAPTSAFPGTEGIIYTNGTLIAGPADWETCEQAAINYAQQQAPEKIRSWGVWEEELRRREAVLKELNQEIKDRKLGIGAVLGRVGEDR